MPLRPFSWATSFFRSADAPVAFTVSSTAVASALSDIEDTVRTQPTEPRNAFEGGQIVAVAGKAGPRLTPPR